MEYRIVDEILRVEEKEVWDGEFGFEYERRVYGLDGLKVVALVYLFDYLCLYPSNRFGIAEQKTILLKAIKDDTFTNYISDLYKYISDCLIQNNPEAIQSFINSPETQNAFKSIFEAICESSKTNLNTDCDLFNFISKFLNFKVFFYDSLTKQRLSFKQPESYMNLFIKKSPADEYSILYTKDLNGLLAQTMKFDEAIDRNNHNKTTVIIKFNRDCKLCKSKYESYIFPCSCIICHVCIEENYFIKNNFNCPKCKYKLDITQRFEVLEFIKSLEWSKLYAN